MSRLYFLAAILFIVSTAALGQQMADTDSRRSSTASRDRDLREIERLEIEWNRINEVSDSQAKGRLLADDSYHVGPSGRIYTREQDIAAARASETHNRTSNSTLKFIITNKRIRLYKDIAVVTATGTSIRTTPDGRKKIGNSFRAVHIWEKRNGRWLIVVDQVTRIGN